MSPARKPLMTLLPQHDMCFGRESSSAALAAGAWSGCAGAQVAKARVASATMANGLDSGTGDTG
jgi:hypothetical protein